MRLDKSREIADYHAFGQHPNNVSMIQRPIPHSNLFYPIIAHPPLRVLHDHGRSYIANSGRFASERWPHPHCGCFPVNTFNDCQEHIGPVRITRDGDLQENRQRGGCVDARSGGYRGQRKPRGQSFRGCTKDSGGSQDSRLARTWRELYASSTGMCLLCEADVI